MNAIQGMATGIVERFDAAEGFGIVRPDDGGRDVLVPASAAERAGLSDLDEDRKLACEPVADRRSGEVAADSLDAE